MAVSVAASEAFSAAALARVSDSFSGGIGDGFSGGGVARLRYCLFRIAFSSTRSRNIRENRSYKHPETLECVEFEVECQVEVDIKLKSISS